MKKDEKQLSEFVLACIENYCLWYSGGKDIGNGKEWLSNDSTRKDVYSQKPVEYLEAISKGLDPVWDSELKKYVYDDPNATKNTTSTKTLGSSVDPQANEKVDEDLPF